jgi:hypothetical protein
VKHAKLWVVRDAGPTSRLEDICWHQEVARLEEYILGAGPGAWRRENHTLHDDEWSAKREAEKRLEARALTNT